MRELGPSSELRRWFNHDPARWQEFQQRYRAELQDPRCQSLLEGLLARARAGSLTLVYGACDRDHNQAVVLRDLLQERLSGPRDREGAS